MCISDFIMIADAMVSTGLAAAGYKYVNLGKDETTKIWNYILS